MSKITLSWANLSNIHTGQNIYKSLTPFDSSTLPTALTTLPKNARSYVDNDVVEGLSYYYAVSTVSDSGELVSEVKKIDAVLSGGDPHWDKVVALLHFDDSLTKNEAGSDFLVYGNPQLVTGKFGDAIYGDGQHGVMRDDANFIFGSQDFTIECFWKPVGIDRTVFAFNSYGSTAHTVYQFSQGLTFWNGSSNLIISNVVVPSSDFSHVALVRQNDIASLFLNGVLLGSAPYALTLNNNGLRTGTVGTNNPAGGAIDEFRVTKGVARYTENFTPPTNPFPNY